MMIYIIIRIPPSFCGRSLKVDAIIRGGIQRYTDQLGRLWNSLATYYVRSGLFERVSLDSVFTSLQLSSLTHEEARKFTHDNHK